MEAAVSAAWRPGAAVLTAALVIAAASEARALDFGLRDPGARAGLSLDPDQVHAGVHADLARSGNWRLRPVAGAGFGNGVRLLAVHADLVRRWGSGSWRPYAGAGPGLSLADVTDGVGEGRGLEASAVVSALAGAEFVGRRSRRGTGRRHLAEVRLGFGDTPDLAVFVGVSF